MNMKNLQKGFILPALLVIIALLVIGGGVYVYENKKTEAPVVVDTETQQTNTQTPPVSTQINNPPSQIDTSFKILSPKTGDAWKIGGTYSVKFQNLPKGSFVQGWLQNKNEANTGTASIGVVDSGRDGNPSSNIQITIPSQWCGGSCGAVEYVAPGQYRLLLRIYPSVNNSSYQTFYSDYFTITSTVTTNVTSTLLIVQTTGGLCVYGGCFSEITIRKDGTFTNESGDGKTSGNLGVNAVKNLQTLIESSNYSALRSTPFTEICPTAYDGFEVTYKFQTSRGEETIASCQTKIDSSSPLFKEIQNIRTLISS